ncbi:DUF3566 domain-containing protein [Streptomyces beihaiensis]|uniref:DUF3566 domain-containing protein n=1 Tax=Streptomyces beihaiensis TaxID=2984495 RepID=A0ABT3U357_9ACTN|nr:DUF3566 domain-containing protein [Streptomyces beihaiensis]MCX3063754.1 DUF3566 domain-containing protein [Streptomyces beihaiensis]
MGRATGAGSTGTSTGTRTDGGRGSAHDTQDSPDAQDAPGPKIPKIPHESQGPQGGTVTDTRGPQTQQYEAGGGALPGESQQAPQPQQAQPYHPPQAYQQGAQTPTPGGAVRVPRTGARTTPRTRKARLRVAKADPWSVMKVSFLLSIALGICTIVAAAVLWMVMDAMGVFSTVGGTISEATGSNESNGFDLQTFLSLPHVLMFTTIIAVIDVVLATALATLGAFIYNLSAGFVGGVELTLAEDE